MTKLRYTMFVVTIFLVLALSAMSTVPALADDTTPPPTDTPTLETPPTEEVTEEAAPVVEEVPPTEVPVVEEIVPEEPAPVEETAPQEETVAELLTQVPEGTDVVVVNEEGETVPLVTQEAADAILSSDPQWCPVGVTPGGAGCTAPTSSFAQMLANLTAMYGPQGPSKAGVIWVEASYDSSVNDPGATAFIFNGHLLTNMANYALTINGGWTGSGTTLNSNDLSEFNVPLSIYYWNNTVTINNLLITGAFSTFDPNEPVTAFALNVNTTAKITVNNVDVVNNTAATDYYGGASLTSYNFTNNTGSVAVNDSTFNGNKGTGVHIGSLGAITIKNMSANENTRVGAQINNIATPAKAVTFTGSNYFNSNGYEGLTVVSQGAITLSNVTAMYNGHSGVELNNCFYNDNLGYCTSQTAPLVISAPITIKGASNFSNNGWDGLRIWSSGAITLGNITANDNGTDAARPGQTIGYDAYGKGVFLHNYGSYTPKAITLTGTNVFNNNASTGFYAYGWSKISVNNLTANDNGCNTGKESASMCDGAVLDGSGVTLTGYGVFNGNYDDGLFASSYGAVTLNNLYAENNGGWGVGIDSYGSTAAVSILGTNTFNNNLDNGLNVRSQGAVTLSNITANDNNSDGVYVDNAWKWVWDPILSTSVQVLVLKPITLNGTNIFNSNTAYGFEAHSSGIITTNNITASFNGNGVYLDNCLYDPPPGIDDCQVLSPKAVTMNGNNNTNFNNGDGLYIESLGAIKVNNLTASNNGGKGAVLDNNWTAANGTVTITGFGNTSMNGVRGLAIYSRGTVTTSNLTANSNRPATSAASGDTFHDGVYINNATDPAKLMNVTLLGINQFNDNWNTGLQISSFGVVVLNNVIANNNGEPNDLTNNPTPEGDGVKVNNSGSNVAKAVTLNGINIFNGNLNDGLEILSKGAIVVNKVTANNNGGNGASFNNQNGTVNSVITLLGYGTFNGNDGDGLYALSHGAITMNNLTAGFNLGDGVYLDNDSATATPVTVNLLGVNSFNDNNQSGLMVYSDGQITVNNVTANNNINGYGAHLDNTTNGSLLIVKGITVQGTNMFVNNFLDGLYFTATGNVILTRITADLNDGDLINTYAGAGIKGVTAGTITLTCGSMNLNEGSGYDLTAGIGKLITIKGVFTYGNGSANVTNVTPLITRTCPLP